MKARIEAQVEKFAELVSSHAWVWLIFFLVTPLLFTGLNRFITGRDSFADPGDYAEIAVEMIVMGLVGLLIWQMLARRTRVIRQLRDGEKRYRQLFHIAPEPMVVHRGGKILLANEAAAQTMGLGNPGDLIGASWFDFIPLENQAAARERQRVVEETGQPVPFVEVPFVTPDGRILFGEIMSVPTTYEGGPAVLSVGRDVTTRKRAEDALKESEMKHRLVVDNVREGIFVAQDGMLKFANPAVPKTTGYSIDELLKQPFGSFIFEDDRSLVAEVHRARMEGDASHRRYPVRIVSKAGEIRWIELECVLINWEGNPAALCFASDITRRRKMEEALRQSEKRYRELVENANDIIYLTDSKGCFVIFNPVGLRVTGYSQEEISGMCYLDVVHPDYRKQAERFYGLQYIKKIPDTYYELPILTKQGETVWIGQQVQLAMEDNEIVGFQAICRDITDRKRMEEEQELLRAQLFQAQKLEAIGTLTGGVAHEFNNILTVILGFAEMLLLDKVATDPDSEDLQKIVESARRGGELVKGLLAFSGKTSAELRRVNLNNVLKSCTIG